MRLTHLNTLIFSFHSSYTLLRAALGGADTRLIDRLCRSGTLTRGSVRATDTDTVPGTAIPPAPAVAAAAVAVAVAPKPSRIEGGGEEAAEAVGGGSGRGGRAAAEGRGATSSCVPLTEESGRDGVGGAGSDIGAEPKRWDTPPCASNSSAIATRVVVGVAVVAVAVGAAAALLRAGVAVVEAGEDLRSAMGVAIDGGSEAMVRSMCAGG